MVPSTNRKETCAKSIWFWHDDHAVRICGEDTISCGSNQTNIQWEVPAICDLSEWFPFQITMCSFQKWASQCFRAWCHTMISSGATFYLREAPRGSVHSLKEEREDRNENIPSIQDLLEKYQRYSAWKFTYTVISKKKFKVKFCKTLKIYCQTERVHISRNHQVFCLDLTENFVSWVAFFLTHRLLNNNT